MITYDRPPKDQRVWTASDVTILLLLIAVVLLVAVILTGIYLDNEPYACTP